MKQSITKQGVRNLDTAYSRPKNKKYEPGICPHCRIPMEATAGHSYLPCNSWTCAKCGHEEPELGSLSLVDL